MFNKIIIYNQGIVCSFKKLEIVIEKRSILIEIHKNSILKIKPDLYCYISGGNITFQEDKTELIEVFNYRCEEFNYKENLKNYLEKVYIPEKTQNMTNKMDLLRFNLSINNKEKALKVLRQMQDTGSVKMIKLIFNKFGNIKNDEQRAKNYNNFIEICNEIDIRSAYVFALEVYSTFRTSDLFHLPEDLSKISNNSLLINDKNYKPLDVSKVNINNLDINDESYKSSDVHLSKVSNINIGKSVIKDESYELSIFLMLKIAIEFVKRDQNKLAGSILIQIAIKTNNLVDRNLQVELLSLSLILMDKYNTQLLDFIFNDKNIGFYLTPAQIFYIKARKTLEKQKYGKNTIQKILCINQQTDSYNILISSHNNIFNFDVIKNEIRNVFTDKINITVKSKYKGYIPLLGIVDDKEEFYQSLNSMNTSIIKSNRDINIRSIILETGEEIKVEYNMKLIHRKNDLILIDILTVDWEGYKHINNKEGKCRLVKFEFKNGKEFNYSFVNSEYEMVVSNILYVFFNIKMSIVEMNVEIDQEIYETRKYRIS